MDEKTKRMVEQLRSNPAAMQALMGSSEGQNLMRLLTQGDQGAALKRAAQDAVRGNQTELVRMISNLMNTPEGARAVQNIQKKMRP